MNAYTILKTDVYTNPKTGDKVAQITVRGFEDKIWRSQAQFLAELKGSQIVPPGMVDFNSRAAQSILRGLVGGTVYGELEWNAAGSEWEVTEDHPSITNDQHDKYGEYEVGDMIPRETSGFHVKASSLLSFTPSEAWEERQANAEAKANAGSFMDLFAVQVKSATATPTGDDDNGAEDNGANEEPPADIIEEDVVVTAKEKAAAKKAAKLAAAEK